MPQSHSPTEFSEFWAIFPTSVLICQILQHFSHIVLRLGKRCTCDVFNYWPFWTSCRIPMVIMRAQVASHASITFRCIPVGHRSVIDLCPNRDRSIFGRYRSPKDLSCYGQWLIHGRTSDDSKRCVKDDWVMRLTGGDIGNVKSLSHLLRCYHSTMINGIWPATNPKWPKTHRKYIRYLIGGHFD